MKKIILLLFAIFSCWQINAQVSAYGFSQSTGTYTPLVGGTVVASYTNPTTSAGSIDNVIYPLPSTIIPFMFNYNGVGYDGLNVSSNGFVTFGATAPLSTTYGPLNATTTYDGAISAFGRDLEGGFVFSGNLTNGSPTLLNVSDIGPAQVGDFISGTGIPALTTITAITGSTITMSANATASTTLGLCEVGGTWSNIQYGIEGVAPNRVFVIQYSNFKRSGVSVGDTQHMTLNFQIRLSETSNAINVVYGNCSPGLTTSTTVIQVGLRGATNVFTTNVNNRLNVKGTSDWATSVQGTLNSSGQIFNNTAPANVISSGLTYTWTSPVPCTGTPTGGLVTPATRFICSGTAPGILTASGFSSGVSGLLFQWEQSPDGVAWIDAVGGTNATTSAYTPPNFSGTPIQYRVKVTCSNSTLFAYSTPAIISSSVPSPQASNTNVTFIGSIGATVNWTAGNTNVRRIVVLSDSPTIVDPVNGIGPVLVANTVYSGTGQQIIYDNTGSTVNITGGLIQNTTYYVKVYEYLRCIITATTNYDYYYNTTTGTNVASFTTIVPPLNDNCSGAVPLTVGANFAANAIVANNLGATASQLADPTIPAPACVGTTGYGGGDIWYSVVVPSTGNIIIDSNSSVGSTITDIGMQVFSGPCNALVLVECDDDDSLNGNFSLVNLSGPTARTPGEVLYIRVFEYQNNAFGEFQISAFDCPSATPAPTGAAAQSFCTSATVADLVTTTGTGIKWYTTPTLGTALLPTDTLASGNIYYASQTTTPGCEGLARLAVTVTIDTVLPTTPTGAAAQTFCSVNNPTLASLAVTGTGLVWYDAATLGNVLPSTTVLTATTYYVASSAGACVSARLAISTTNICPVAPCFTGGIFPTATYTPTTCNGLIQNVITTFAWPGEYSNVNVTTGQTYVFGSSVATDIITISADSGVTTVATGTGTATWVSNVTGVVRFYIHLAACGASNASRTRYVICGIPSLALPDYVNLQFPPSITVPAGGSGIVYGQVYEAGLTDVVPNIAGQAPGIQAWVGISPVGANTNPNTWTTWVPATWNSGSVGNNDEYQATIGATLAPGVYYYATRFNLDNGAYVYGGLNNFWNATTNPSGVLTITPPANDNFANPTVATCGSTYNGNTSAATLDEDNAPDGFGAALTSANLWYSFTGTGAAQTVTLSLCPSSFDTTLLVYTGTSGNLTLVAGNDDFCGPGSQLSFASNGTTTYYISVSGYGTLSSGPFAMVVTCAAVNPPAVANQDCGTSLPVLVNGLDNNSNNSFGTVNPTQPSCDPFGSVQDVWFSFVAPTSGSVTALVTPGTMTSLNFNIYSGACGALVPVADTCNSNLIAATSESLTALTPGTTYYIQVWSNSSEQGTFTVRLTDNGPPPPAPANDNCANAIALTPGGVFDSNPLTGSTLNATNSVVIPLCLTFAPPGNSDVWYSVVVPASGNLTIETQQTATNPLVDTVVAAFSGTCGTLTPVGCNDDDGIGNMSLFSLTGQTPGSTLYVGVWKYGTISPSATENGFRISAYDVSLGNSSFDNANFSYYPNPVKNTLNLSYSQDISNVEVYNLLGQRVSSIAVNATQVEVDMSNLPRAAYIVKVTSNNQVKTIKVIKE